MKTGGNKMKKSMKIIALVVIAIFCFSTTALACGPCPIPPIYYGGGCGGSSGWGITAAILGGVMLSYLLSYPRNESRQIPVIYKQEPKVVVQPVYVNSSAKETVVNTESKVIKNSNEEKVELATHIPKDCYIINGKLYAPVKEDNNLNDIKE